MEINKLTGINERLPRPQLSEAEIFAVKATARAWVPRHVNLWGREYWADMDGGVFVVAWEGGSSVSGDPI